MESMQRSSSMTEREYAKAWEGYRRSLALMTNDELSVLLSSLNRQLQEQATSMLSSTLSESLHAIDRPVLSSTPMAIPSASPPMDRGARPSPQQQEGALDLLARQRRLGPRVAGKLVMAQARAARRG